MEIKNSAKLNGELNKVEIYKATKQADKSVKDLADGSVLKVVGFVEFEEPNKKTGEISELLSLILEDGECVATQSTTFKDNFFDMWNLFDEDVEVLPIIKISGETKAGRPYVSCKLGL